VRSGRALRAFDALLGLCLLGLILVTAAMAVRLGIDGGSVTLPGRLEPSYSVRTAQGGVVRVGAHEGGRWSNEPRLVTDAGLVDDQADVHVRVTVPLAAGGDAWVVVVGGAASLAMAWLALLELRLLLASARQGEPFTRANVHRLWWVAGVALSWPGVDWLLTRGINATIDVRPAVTMSWPGPGFWTSVLVGVGLLAIAEVLREGVALRELELSTV
jgi:hypothetical protein